MGYYWILFIQQLQNSQALPAAFLDANVLAVTTVPERTVAVTMTSADSEAVTVVPVEATAG